MNLSKPRGKTLALLLILAGAFLFFYNVGILPIHDLDAYWPVWMIVVGALIFENWRHVTAVVWAAGWVVTGVLLILGNLHVLPVNEEVIWPVLLIVVGINMLISPVSLSGWGERMRQASEHAREARIERRRMWRERKRYWTGRGPSDLFLGDRLREAILFSSMSRRVETQQFEGGSLDVVFGSMEIDLSDAAIATPDGQARLKLAAVFGGIEIIVPRTWKVLLQATAVFGSCENKTLPPRPEPGVQSSTLIVTGDAVFGGITIQN